MIIGAEWRWGVHFRTPRRAWWVEATWPQKSHYYLVSGVILSKVIYTLHQRRAEIWLSEIRLTYLGFVPKLAAHFPGKLLSKLQTEQSYFFGLHIETYIWGKIPSVMLPLRNWHFVLQPRFNSRSQVWAQVGKLVQRTRQTSPHPPPPPVGRHTLLPSPIGR